MPKARAACQREKGALCAVTNTKSCIATILWLGTSFIMQSSPVGTAF